MSRLSHVLGDHGWHKIDTEYLLELTRFARSNVYVQAVQSVCHRSLLSGDVDVRPVDDVKPDDERDEMETRQRGDMNGIALFAIMCRDDEHGFVPTTAVANETHPSIVHTDPLRPTVLNLARVYIDHRITVNEEHEWMFWERPVVPMEHNASSPHPGCRQIHNVRVFGTSLPGPDGVIRSKVATVYNGMYQMLLKKMDTTIRADMLRSDPILVTRELNDASRHADKIALGSASAEFDQALPRAAMEEIHSVHQRVRDANCGTSTEPVTKKRKAGELRQQELDAGRDLVSQHMAEAPADLLPTRQSVLEDVCFLWGVPMSMLSSGDATGRAKLNTETAGPETARIFKEAQADRRRRCELIISDLYQFMYAEKSALQYIKTNLAKGVEPTKEAIARHTRHARVTVRIPAKQELADILLLWEKGIITDACMQSSLKINQGLNQSDFHRKPLIDIKDLAGIAPPDAQKPKPKAKKAKKS